MNNQLTIGIHHVTALCDDAQANVDFYAGILGLRLVKKTINFDAPEVYHLYYGNEKGSPGTIMTFFPYAGLTKGRHGIGQMTTTSFSAPEDSLDYWLKRLEKFKVKFKPPQERFKGETFISFEDIHGLGLELVFTENDDRSGFSYGLIPVENSIRGFHGVSLSEERYERTAALLLKGLDHHPVAEEGNCFRYSTSDKPGDYVDVFCAPDNVRGLSGSGTIHHLAFATPDDASQLQIRQNLMDMGLNVTPVMNRQYFRSIYFREPGGILFEVATLPPGFLVDETVDELGESLKLPPWIEPSRSEIEKALLPIQFNLDKFRD